MHVSSDPWAYKESCRGTEWAKGRTGAGAPDAQREVNHTGECVSWNAPWCDSRGQSCCGWSEDGVNIWFPFWEARHLITSMQMCLVILDHHSLFWLPSSAWAKLKSSWYSEVWGFQWISFTFVCSSLLISERAMTRGNCYGKPRIVWMFFPGT